LNRLGEYIRFTACEIVADRIAIDDRGPNADEYRPPPARHSLGLSEERAAKSISLVGAKARHLAVASEILPKRSHLSGARLFHVLLQPITNDPADNRVVPRIVCACDELTFQLESQSFSFRVRGNLPAAGQHNRAGIDIDHESPARATRGVLPPQGEHRAF
jgi:hypothetical protein